MLENDGSFAVSNHRNRVYVILIIRKIKNIIRFKCGLITSSTFIEVSPNTIATYTSKSPRHRREHQLLLLWLTLILANFDKQE